MHRFQPNGAGRLQRDEITRQPRRLQARDKPPACGVVSMLFELPLILWISTNLMTVFYCFFPVKNTIIGGPCGENEKDSIKAEAKNTINLLFHPKLKRVSFILFYFFLHFWNKFHHKNWQETANSKIIIHVSCHHNWNQIWVFGHSSEFTFSVTVSLLRLWRIHNIGHFAYISH